MKLMYITKFELATKKIYGKRTESIKTGFLII